VDFGGVVGVVFVLLVVVLGNVCWWCSDSVRSSVALRVNVFVLVSNLYSLITIVLCSSNFFYFWL